MSSKVKHCGRASHCRTIRTKTGTKRIRVKRARLRKPV